MIEINNLTNSQVNEKFLKKVTEIVLKKESASWRKNKINLSIALVEQERIKALNKRYRGEQRVADVLAFPYRASRGGEDEEENKVFFAHDDSGEIVICLKEVEKNAKSYGSTFKNELARVIIHGILHLLGYNHEKSKKETKRMRKKEEYYLSKI